MNLGVVIKEGVTSAGTLSVRGGGWGGMNSGALTFFGGFLDGVLTFLLAVFR